MEIQVAKRIHVTYATIISETISSSAQVRGTGIARRTPEYIQQKIELESYMVSNMPSIPRSALCIF